MYKTILVPLDGSELAEMVLPHVETLVKACGDKPELVLLQVCEPVSGKLAGIGPGAVYVMTDLAQRAEQSSREEAEEYLAATAKKLEARGLKVRTELKIGNPGGEILDYAAENPVDLIAMASHGRSGISRWAYGSVASQVLRGIATPILVVTPPREKR